MSNCSYTSRLLIRAIKKTTRTVVFQQYYRQDLKEKTLVMNGERLPLFEGLRQFIE